MSPDSPSASPSARVQTPSDLKWLLNERAALEGQAQLASERQSTLERQVARLSLELQEASSELTQTRDSASAIADRIGALDATIRLMYPGVNPAAAGCVRAWAGRYGERGALTEFVREHLRALSPYASLAADIQRHAVEHFGLVLSTPLERSRFKCSLRTVLRQLRDQHGVLETLENWQGRRSQPLWRWKQSTPALDALRQAALAAEAADDKDPHPDAL